MFRKAYAVRFGFMPVFVHLTQIRFDVQILTRLISVPNHTTTQIDLFVAASATLAANRFPVFPV
jgi:hypothetical protein